MNQYRVYFVLCLCVVSSGLSFGQFQLNSLLGQKGYGELTGQVKTNGTFFKEGKQAVKQGDHYGAACNFLDAMSIKSKKRYLNRAKKSVAKGYEQKIDMIREMEQQNNWSEAVEAYRHLQKYIGVLKKFKLDNFTTINLDEAIVKASSQGAEKSYQKGLAYFEKQRYQIAVEQMRRALEFEPNYKDCHLKISEIYYEEGTSFLHLRNYVKSGESYRYSHQETNGYRDAGYRATEIFYRLGEHALESGFPRSANQFFEQVISIDPNYRDISSKLKVSKNAARYKLTFGDVKLLIPNENQSLSIGRLIFNELKSSMSGASSSFLTIVRDLESADYVVSAEIHQLTVNDPDVVTSRNSKRVQFYEADALFDAKENKEIPRPKTATIQYETHQDSIEVIIAGAVQVNQRSNDAVLVSVALNARAEDSQIWSQALPGQEFADKADIGNRIRRILKTSDTLIHEAVRSVAKSISAEILAGIDVVKDAPPPMSLDLSFI